MNNRCQFKIQAHMLNRNRSSQDSTEVYDVTSKESFNKVKVRLGEINKHVSDGINKLPIENKFDLTSQKVQPKDEAKDFSKSEAKLVGVMDTLQHAVSIIEKEMVKNLAFLEKEIDRRNTNKIMAALIIRETSKSRAFSEQ